VLGYVCAIPLPRAIGLDPMWGAAGLTASAGVAGWVEMLLLRATLNARIGPTGPPLAFVATLWSTAAGAAAVAWAVKLTSPTPQPIVLAALVLGVYGVLYVGTAFAVRVPEARSVLSWSRFAAGPRP
jgi:putative peptidoglycan lipid II flippase